MIDRAWMQQLWANTSSALAGETVQLNGVDVDGAVVSSLSETEVAEFWPEGARNVANADCRMIKMPTASAAAEDDVITVDGADYRVVRIARLTLQSAIPCVCYRDSADPSATVAPAGETGAGSRKVLFPPDNPN